MTPSLDHRRTELHGQLTSLERAHGAAVLDGRKFDASSIPVLRQELTALDAAAGEQSRRDREAAAAELQAARGKLLSRFAELEQERLSAWEDAEKATRALASAASRILDTSQTQAVIVSKLGKPVPGMITRPEILSLLAWRLSAVLSGISGGRLGTLEWRPGPVKPSDNWREREAAVAANQLADFLPQASDNSDTRN